MHFVKYYTQRCKNIFLNILTFQMLSTVTLQIIMHWLSRQKVVVVHFGSQCEFISTFVHFSVTQPPLTGYCSSVHRCRKTCIYMSCFFYSWMSRCKWCGTDCAKLMKINDTEQLRYSAHLRVSPWLWNSCPHESFIRTYILWNITLFQHFLFHCIYL